MASQVLALRDYQDDAIKAVRAGWATGVRRQALVLPTGAGKTVVFAHMAAIMHERGVRSVVIAHRDELIGQAAAKLAACAPGLKVGIVKAERRELDGSDVIVASVQSLARPEQRARLAAVGVRLVIVDEAHHAVANTYMEIMRDLGCFDDDPLQGAYALGVTATLARSDRLALGQVWQEVAYKRDIIDMIREGHLVNAKGIRVKIDGLDLSRVSRFGGDWRNEALGGAMHDALAPAAIARAYVQHAAQRRGIAFWPTVDLAYEGAAAFRAAGVRGEAIDGRGMPLSERRRVLADFARGDVQVVHNCMILTEGFDAPWASAVVIARPTSSVPLFVQMAGRGLRPYPGKADALIIDVVGVTGRHKLASVVDLAGADRVEKLPPELQGYDDIDLLALVCGGEEGNGNGGWRKPGKDGPLTSEIVDLFGTSRQSWLRTQRGVWFLSGEKSIVFLAPGSEPGRYTVARCPTRVKGGEFLRRDVDLDMAMSWGEQFAMEGPLGTKTLVRRGAAWRKGQPSQQQMVAAARMDVSVVDGMTKGELSDALSVRTATWRLDRMPCVAGVTDRGYW